MRSNYIIALSFSLLLLSAGLLRADCTDFSRATSWSVEGDQKIVFYRGPVRFAVLTLQDCRVYPNSNVQLTKPYMCGSDTIMIDGQECSLVSLDSLE
jgi:hypothetical protein